MYYSLGYKYDPNTGKTVQTGAIVLQTALSNVSVEKDGETLEQNGFLTNLFSNSIKIEGLDLGVYNIKVKKADYYDWEKNIEVFAGQLKFNNIILVKTSYESTNVFEETVYTDNGLWKTNDGKMIAFLHMDTDPEESGLFVVNIEAEERKLVANGEKLALIGEIQSVEWSDGEKELIIKALDGETERYYLIDPEEENRIYLITNSVAEAIKSVDGEPFYVFEDFIIFLSQDSIYSFNYKDKQTRKITDGVTSFCKFQNSVYFFKKEEPNKGLFSLNLNNLSYETRIAEMPDGYEKTGSFTAKKENNRFILISDGSLYLIDRNATVQKINSNVDEAHFFNNGKRIVYFNNHEIWIYYTEDKLSQPEKKKGDNELINRFSSDLDNVQIYQDEEHIIYREGSALKLAELDGRDRRNIFNLLTNEAELTFYSRNNNLLYFVEGDKLKKIDLVEE